jgi:hypothetical protein
MKSALSKTLLKKAVAFGSSDFRHFDLVYSQTCEISLVVQNKSAIFRGIRLALHPFESGIEDCTTSLSIKQSKLFSHRGINKMKKKTFLQIAALVMTGFAFLLFFESDHTWAQAQSQLRQSVERKFEEYRTAIKENHQVDIKNFKDRTKGGFADAKAITDYDLGQLLEGIKYERQHTTDNLLALELAMDHLETIPDYYTRIARLEWECKSENLLSR